MITAKLIVKIISGLFFVVITYFSSNLLPDTNISVLLLFQSCVQRTWQKKTSSVSIFACCYSCPFPSLVRRNGLCQQWQLAGLLKPCCKGSPSGAVCLFHTPGGLLRRGTHRYPNLQQNISGPLKQPVDFI